MVRLPAFEDENDPIVESPNTRQKRTQPDASLDFDTQDSGQNNLEPSRAQPQVPVMTGTHFHSLDEKGRIIVPAKLRPALGGGFWMMLDEKDNIGIYQEQTGYDILRYFEAKIADDPEDEEVAAAVERTLEAMDFVEVEGGWRVPIPEFLRFRAGLTKEVVTVGVLNHAVLWDRDKWEEAKSTQLASPEVRKRQASLLRAAASGVGLQKKEAPQREEADVAGRDAGVAPGGANAPTEAASPGDGGRGAGVLALSQLGRKRS